MVFACGGPIELDGDGFDVATVPAGVGDGEGPVDGAGGTSVVFEIDGAVVGVGAIGCGGYHVTGSEDLPSNDGITSFF